MSDPIGYTWKELSSIGTQARRIGFTAPTYIPTHKLTPVYEHPADASKWIQVSERLPEMDRQLVVVFVPTSEPLVWPAQWDSKHQTFSSNGGWFEVNEVTQWMPLPAPLKG